MVSQIVSSTEIALQQTICMTEKGLERLALAPIVPPAIKTHQF